MAYNPGMAAENQFLRDSVVTLLDSLDTVGAAVEPSLFNKVFYFNYSPLYHFNQQYLYAFIQAVAHADLSNIRGGLAVLSSVTVPTASPTYVIKSESHPSCTDLFESRLRFF
jgi:hypothetical protein